MPFHVRLASNDKPRPNASAAARGEHPPSNFREFCQGISFGFGLLMVLAGVYLVIGSRIAALPDLKTLISYWVSFG